MKRTTLKKMKWALILLLVIAAVLFILNLVFRYFLYDKYTSYLKTEETEEGTDYTPLTESKADVPGYDLVAENDKFKLYTDPVTTQIAIYDRTTGTATYSNPQDADTDSTSTASNQSELSSTLVVRYYNPARNSAKIDNYSYSIQYGQFKTESIENGVRYVYTLSEPEDTDDIVPRTISEERMNQFVGDLSAKDRRNITGHYKLKDGTYTLLKKAEESNAGMKKLNDLFVKAGYTAEDYAADMGDTETEETMSFTIPVEYRLTEDGFEASVPASEITEEGGYSIYRIDLLKFFGAGGSTDDGYMMVPDGSGALINFNNGKISDDAYSQYVYDMDPVTQSYIKTENTEAARLPVFGIKNGDSAFLAVITSGDALSSVNADVSGKLNKYNYCYAEFSLREMELLNMFGVEGTKADTPSLEKNLYDETFTIRYSMLSGDDASYSGMARCYRNQLIGEGKLAEQTKDTELPFYLDILGGVEENEHILGIPYRGIYPMTTFTEAAQIAQDCQASGVSNIKMNYYGWFNRGIYHDVADKVNVIGSLGGKSGLEELSSEITENGGSFYADVAFQRVPETSKRFNYMLSASKYYSGYVVSLGALNPSTLRQTSALNWYNELQYEILSPKFLPRYVDAFSSQMEKTDIDGVSLRDLGDVLASDKKRTEVIDRQQAKEVVEGQFETLSATGKKLMVTGGNAYSLSYASDLEGVPVSDSAFFIIDEQIPFYEMVIHGSVNYTGSAINLNDTYNKDNIVLSYIEYGTAPRFLFSEKDSSNIKYTSSADKYSVQYSVWKEDAAEIYSRIAQALDPVAGSAMVSHETLSSGLKKIVYDNGVTIYVNHSEQDITENGITVKAGSYYEEK